MACLNAKIAGRFFNIFSITFQMYYFTKTALTARQIMKKIKKKKFHKIKIKNSLVLDYTRVNFWALKSEQRKIRRSTNFVALTLWKGSSGR